MAKIYIFPDVHVLEHRRKNIDVLKGLRGLPVLLEGWPAVRIEGVEKELYFMGLPFSEEPAFGVDSWSMRAFNDLMYSFLVGLKERYNLMLEEIVWEVIRRREDLDLVEDGIHQVLRNLLSNWNIGVYQMFDPLWKDAEVGILKECTDFLAFLLDELEEGLEKNYEEALKEGIELLEYHKDNKPWLEPKDIRTLAYLLHLGISESSDKALYRVGITPLTSIIPSFFLSEESLVKRRDIIMARASLKHMRTNGFKEAVLITGANHVDGIRANLQREVEVEVLPVKGPVLRIRKR